MFKGEPRSSETQGLIWHKGTGGGGGGVPPSTIVRLRSNVLRRLYKFPYRRDLILFVLLYSKPKAGTRSSLRLQAKGLRLKSYIKSNNGVRQNK